MTEITTARIRWEDAPAGQAMGYVGMLSPCVFRSWEPEDGGSEWLLTAAALPGEAGKRLHGPTPDALKAEAERWLERFVSSLGAVFPDGPARPSRAWHADWAEVDRDQGGNAILRHKPTGGMYKVLPVEEC